MGVYLSSPVTEKESVDGHSERFIYGASSMQGWRMAQEDAHNCIPSFDEKTETSFFAVYDGHGGPEVAKYCEKYFPKFVKKLLDKHDDPDDTASFIKNAFLEFDATLTTEDVIKELKELAGSGDDNEEDEDDDPVGRSETELLKEEADMPLDQLLAQYKNTPLDGIHKSQEIQSTSQALKSKNELASDVGSSSSDTQNGPSSSRLTPTTPPALVTSSSPSTCIKDSSSQISNGDHPVLSSSENDNAQTVKAVNIAGDQQHSDCSNNNEKSTSSITKNHLPSLVTDEPQSPSSKGQQAADNHCSSTSKSADGNIKNTSSSLDSEQPGGSTRKKSSSLGAKNEPSASGTSSSSGVRSSKAKAAIETAKLDGDMDSSDDDDEDEEDVWEDMSDDDDDDEDEDDDEQDADVPVMDHSDEEPGSDSGCTACVVLMQGRKLIVANAGDSRCVLSRAGKAVDLSFDHKPEDDSEKDRIENAGGKVTADGRVNGGLNLSRAIGDHVYKRNEDLPAEEQMITALPDVETADICDEDQFIVIACDGIWNFMSSQEVVDFVSENLKDPDMRQKPSAICEELFDHCLAPNTSGDGTGCDNMTCIIIILNTNIASKAQPVKSELTEETAITSTEQQLSSEDAGLTSLKRCAADKLEGSEEKRLKAKEEVA